jgi:hypothetical protein
LLNRSITGNQATKQKEKQIDKEELEFYRKRIFHLFKELICNRKPDDLPPDVKYAYDTFVKASIRYFKVADNNDLLQEEYKCIDISASEPATTNTNTKDDNKQDPNKLLMRRVKMDVPTLDKYVKRVSNKKEETVFLPKSREVDIKNPELKNKGIKKNINNVYEDNK